MDKERPMLWIAWIDMVLKLRTAFSREKSFLWFIVALMGLTTRSDNCGVASFIRAMGLRGKSYECMRQFFRSTSVDLSKLTRLWNDLVNSVLENNFVKFNGRKVYLIDGIKAPKEGSRMPGVKWIFQQSQNNSKPSYIFGHSCQALHALVSAGKSFISIPLIIRIHEGLGNRRGSIVMRVLDLVLTLKIRDSYIVGDAYYWSGALSKKLKSQGIDLISRVRSNAIAYLAVTTTTSGVGRPKKYGSRVQLLNFFKGGGFIQLAIELYGKKEIIKYKEKILISKHHQDSIKYVFTKLDGNNCIFASTDLSLSGPEIIQLYCHRFKIEYSFKEFVHDFGGFCYRFWSKKVEKSRKREIEKRDAKVEAAYHLHMQMAVIAQGLANILAIKYSQRIWDSQSYWIRTIRPNVIPSAAVVRVTLREGVSDFLKLKIKECNIIKFIKERRKVDEMEPFLMAS